MFAYAVLGFEILFLVLALCWVLHRNCDQFKVSNDIWGVYQNPAKSFDEQKNLPVITFSRISTGVTVEKSALKTHEK